MNHYIIIFISLLFHHQLIASETQLDNKITQLKSEKIPEVESKLKCLTSQH